MGFELEDAPSMAAPTYASVAEIMAIASEIATARVAAAAAAASTKRRGGLAADKSKQAAKRQRHTVSTTNVSELTNKSREQLSATMGRTRTVHAVHHPACMPTRSPTSSLHAMNACLGEVESGAANAAPEMPLQSSLASIVSDVMRETADVRDADVAAEHGCSAAEFLLLQVEDDEAYMARARHALPMPYRMDGPRLAFVFDSPPRKVRRRMIQKRERALSPDPDADPAIEAVVTHSVGADIQQ